MKSSLKKTGNKGNIIKESETTANSEGTSFKKLRKVVGRGKNRTKRKSMYICGDQNSGYGKQAKDCETRETIEKRMFFEKAGTLRCMPWHTRTASAGGGACDDAGKAFLSGSIKSEHRLGRGCLGFCHARQRKREGGPKVTTRKQKGKRRNPRGSRGKGEGRGLSRWEEGGREKAFRE